MQALKYVHKIKMAYNREEVQWLWLLVVLFLVKGTVPAKKKPICAEVKIRLCLSTEEKDGEIGVLAISHTVAVYFTTFESVIVSRNTKGLIDAAFESSDLLRLNGRVGAILTQRGLWSM